MIVILGLLIVLLVIVLLKQKETVIGHLDVDHFYVESRVPECLTLSSTKESFTLHGNEMDQIHTIQTEYELAIRHTHLVSDYTNDYFTDKRDPAHFFCITRRISASNLKSCIYIPGINDYFYNKQFANQIFGKGYNFYAISFPNFGFASTSTSKHNSTFTSIPGMYKYIDFIVEFYQLKHIDLLIGHSTGGLISTCYAAHRNQHQVHVKRLVLSSPLFEWYCDPHAKSYIRSANFLKHVITPVGLLLREVNLKQSIGTTNLTTCEEFNQLNFNPKYKSLVEIHTYPEWIRACTLMMHSIQTGYVNVKCPVDVLVSDKSVYWEYTQKADNTLDVTDIMKYSHKIGSEVNIHIIPNSVHATFLRIPDITVLLQL
jgi:pimeloyl-ACP methyl ester carboxylesterase